MTSLLASRAARRRSIAYVALLGTSLLLMLISGNPFVRDVQNGVAFAFRPIQSALDGIARDVTSIGSALSDIDRLRVENAALKAENDHLKTEARSAEEIKRENEELTALLQLRNGLQYETVTASVIGRESSEARRAVVIDRGSDDGVHAGDIVIGSGGSLVGRVIEVGGNFSRVVLISDATSTVIGQLLSTGATGKVIGQLGGALVMRDIDSAAKVTIGEEVFTAGIELSAGVRSPYPKGLLIGQVVDVTRDPNEVVQTAFLEPAAPLDQLEFLLVITDYQGGLGEPLETNPPCNPTDGGTLPDSDQPCATTAP